MKSDESMKRDMIKETVWQGLYTGLVLYVSALLALRAGGSAQGQEIFWRYCVPALFLYLAAGVLVCWLRGLPQKKHFWTQGSTVLTWFLCYFVIYFILLIAAARFPGYVRHVFTANAAALFLLWLWDYYYLSGIAKELNHDSGRRLSLVVDLDKKPAGDEEFLKIFEDYCVKNHLDLEYEVRAVPAVVRLNGVKHQVESSYYYSWGGPVHIMVISRL